MKSRDEGDEQNNAGHQKAKEKKNNTRKNGWSVIIINKEPKNKHNAGKMTFFVEEQQRAITNLKLNYSSHIFSNFKKKLLKNYFDIHF